MHKCSQCITWITKSLLVIYIGDQEGKCIEFIIHNIQYLAFLRYPLLSNKQNNNIRNCPQLRWHFLTKLHQHVEPQHFVEHTFRMKLRFSVICFDLFCQCNNKKWQNKMISVLVAVTTQCQAKNSHYSKRRDGGKSGSFFLPDVWQHVSLSLINKTVYWISADSFQCWMELKSQTGAQSSSSNCI